jgi:membrane-associated phospholipid phosphatase
MKTLSRCQTYCFQQSYVGYLRPVFFENCNPDEDYLTCTGGGDLPVYEVRKSFVSGHASTAFCGCLLFTLFMERTIGISSVEVAVAKRSQSTTTLAPLEEQPLDTEVQHIRSSGCGDIHWTVAYRSQPGLRRLGSLVSLLPMGVAVWVAASRIVDNVHFPADVVGGALVGASIASYCHNIW